LVKANRSTLQVIITVCHTGQQQQPGSARVGLGC